MTSFSGCETTGLGKKLVQFSIHEVVLLVHFLRGMTDWCVAASPIFELSEPLSCCCRTWLQWPERSSGGRTASSSAG